MAETHELRLKINAAAAKSGSRDFVRAVTAIKAAVRGLEKDSAGVFKKLAQRTKAAGKSVQIKGGGVDKNAIRSLDQFVKSQSAALRATAATRKGLTSLAAGMRRASDAYLTAGSSSLTLNKSLSATNLLLSRQITLARGAAEALRQTTVAVPRTGGGATGGGGGGRGRSGAEADKAAETQMRVTRALAESTLQAERLATSLAKVGAGTSIREVGRALESLRSGMNGAAGDTKKITAAQNEFKTTMARLSTGLVTLNAKLREEQAGLKNAAAAARTKAKASREAGQAALALSRSEDAAAKSTERQARLQLTTANAMQRVEQETARLSARLRGLGDTKGIETLNAAFGRFRQQAASGFNSMLQLRQGLAQFSSAAGAAKTNIISLASAEQLAAREAKKLARGERDATRQARAMEREMRSVAGASNAASKSFRNATGNLRGLENAFSLSFQAGSAFRSMIGGITLGVFTTNVFAAGNALDQFRVTMQVATDSAVEAQTQFQFIDDTARGLGVSLRGAREDFSKFAIASDIAGVSADTTRGIFSSVAQAMAVLGRSSEDQRLSFLALEQMMSKGVISSEELRRQLGERLPGAVNIMARAIGVTTGELQKLLKEGKLISAEVLPKFADELNRIFGPGLDAAMQRAGTQLGVLRVEFEKFLEGAAQSGLMQQLSFEFRDLTSLMRSPATKRAANTLGEGMAAVAKSMGNAAKFIIKNLDEVRMALKAIFTGLVVRQAVLLANAFVVAGQRALAFVSSIAALTTAEGRNTVAMGVNEGQAAKLNAQLIALSATRGRAAVVTDLHTTSLGRNSLGLRGAAAGQALFSGATLKGLFSLKKWGTGLAIASRGLTALAGPIGLAIAGFSLLPLLFSDTAEAAVEASFDYEDALIRMTSANFSFFKTAVAVEGESLVDKANADARALAQLAIERDRLANSDTFTDAIAISAEKLLSVLSGTDKKAVEALIKIQKEFLETNLSGDALAKKFAELEAAFKRVERLDIAGPAGQAVAEYGRLFNIIGQVTSGQIKAFEALKVVGAEALAALKIEAQQLREEIDAITPGFDRVFSGSGFSQQVGAVATPESLDASGIDDFGSAVGKSVAELEALQVSLNSIEFDPSTQLGDEASFDTLINNAVAYVQRLIDLREQLDDNIAATEDFNARLEGNAGALMTAAEATRQLTAAAEGLAAAQDAVKLSSGRVLQELQIDIDIANLRGADKAVAEYWNSKDGKDFLAGVAKNIQDAELIVAAAVVANTPVGDPQSGLERVLATARDAKQEIEAKLRELFDANAADKGSRKGASDLKRRIKALEKLRDTSLTTEGALQKLRASEELLNSTLAETVLPTLKLRNDILEQLKFETAEAIIKEGMLGQQYVSTAEMIGKTRNQIELLITSRILENELTERGTKALDAEALSILKVFNERKRLADLEDDRLEALKAQGDFIAGTQKEIDVLRLLNSGMIENKEIAEIVLDLKRAGIVLTAEEINQMNLQAATLERLTVLSGGPAQAWLDSVPDMIEAGQMLETEVFGGLSDALAAFLQTGEFSLDSLLNSLQAMSAKILADNAIKGLFDLLGSNGGEGDFFGFSSDIGVDSTEATQKGITEAFSMGTTETREAITASFTTGSTDANTQVVAAFDQGGTSAAEKMRNVLANTPVSVDASGASGFGFGGGTTGGSGGGASGLADDIGTRVSGAGNSAADAIGTSIVDSGSTFSDSLMSIFEGGASQFSGIFAGLGATLGGAVGGSTGSAIGGIIGTVLPLIMSAAFAEGGISNSPSSRNPVTAFPAAMFRNAPSFKSGTANTSGIPALLHDNEAVVPLTAGRRIPIEGGGGPKQDFNISQSFIFPEGDVDSFRKSTNQIAADTAAVVNRAVKANS